MESCEFRNSDTEWSFPTFLYLLNGTTNIPGKKGRKNKVNFTSNLNHSEFHCGLRDFGQTSVLKVTFPNLTWGKKKFQNVHLLKT